MVQYEIVFYTSRHLVKGCAKKSMFRIFRNVLVVALLCIVGIYVIPQNMASFITWFLYAIGMGAVSVFTIVGVNYVVEPDEFKELVLRGKGIVNRKEK